MQTFPGMQGSSQQLITAATDVRVGGLPSDAHQDEAGGDEPTTEMVKESSKPEDDSFSVDTSCSACSEFLRILVVGDAGTGKSSLLHSLCHTSWPLNYSGGLRHCHRGTSWDPLKTRDGGPFDEAGATEWYRRVDRQETASRRGRQENAIREATSSNAIRVQTGHGTTSLDIGGEEASSLTSNKGHACGEGREEQASFCASFERCLSGTAAPAEVEMPPNRQIAMQDQSKCHTPEASCPFVAWAEEKAKWEKLPATLMTSSSFSPSIASSRSTAVPPSCSPTAACGLSPSSSFSFASSFCRRPSPSSSPSRFPSSLSSSTSRVEGRQSASETSSPGVESLYSAEEQDCPACRHPGAYEWTCGVRIFHLFWDFSSADYPARERNSRFATFSPAPSSPCVNASSRSSPQDPSFIADSTSSSSCPSSPWSSPCPSPTEFASSPSASVYPSSCLVEFWEVGGTEALESVRSLVYGQHFDGVWVCFETTSSASFHHAALWTRELCVSLHLPSSFLFPSSKPPASASRNGSAFLSPPSSLSYWPSLFSPSQPLQLNRRGRSGTWPREEEPEGYTQVTVDKLRTESSTESRFAVSSVIQSLPLSVGKATRTTASTVVRLGSLIASPVVSLLAGERERESVDPEERDEDETSRLKKTERDVGKNGNSRPGFALRKLGARGPGRLVSSFFSCSSVGARASRSNADSDDNSDGDEEGREERDEGACAERFEEGSLDAWEEADSKTETPTTSNRNKEEICERSDVEGSAECTEDDGSIDSFSVSCASNKAREHHHLAVRLLQGVCPLLLVGTKHDLLPFSPSRQQPSALEPPGSGTEAGDKGFLPFLKLLRSRSYVFNSLPCFTNASSLGQAEVENLESEKETALPPLAGVQATSKEQTRPPPVKDLAFARGQFCQSSFGTTRENLLARFCGLGTRKLSWCESRLDMDAEESARLSRRICYILNSSPLLLTSAWFHSFDVATLSAFFSDALLCQRLFQQQAQTAQAGKTETPH
ncbi:UNVERIFIED_CONTAM: hypothetical protein HHA_265255 [Hammondia hammondi]|eukprot:XP_008887200.1 hypothetical protein HHA_265255 [Hammondia hammondi]